MDQLSEHHWQVGSLSGENESTKHMLLEIMVSSAAKLQHHLQDSIPNPCSIQNTLSTNH
jgi:hypothetical protein